MKKKFLQSFAILLAIVTSLSGCKKDNAQKDYGSLFKNKVWTGNFSYPGAAMQPVSIEFSEGGQIAWHDLSGDYTGTWNLNGKTLTLNLTTANGFIADITDENKFTNIKSIAGTQWVLADGMLNTAAEIVLDNTSWIAPNLVLNFKPGNKVDMLLGPSGITQYKDVPYVSKGKSVRFAASSVYKWFIVNNSNTFYKGANTFTSATTIYPFDLTKK